MCSEGGGGLKIVQISLTSFLNTPLPEIVKTKVLISKQLFILLGQKRILDCWHKVKEANYWHKVKVHSRPEINLLKSDELKSEYMKDFFWGLM